MVRSGRARNRHRGDRSRGSQTQGRILGPDVPCTNPSTGSPGACRVARVGRASHYRSGSGGNSHCGHPRGLGKRVHLVEKQSGVGGKVALLSRFYPRLCDPHCGLQFALDKLLRSDLVEFHTLSDVVSLEGGPGNFEASIKKRPRYVNEQRCNACGACTAVCPVDAPASLALTGESSAGPVVSGGIGDLLQPKHKAVHAAIPMAFPSAFVVDRGHCPPGCNECEKKCPAQAVDLNQSEEDQILRVGAVLVTTGWDPYPLSRVSEFGYQ